MNDVYFSALDLNLLRILDALLEERSATRAGERLGLSQSAVSHALSRLRHALKDELFLRSSDGLEPAPRALQIAPQVRQGLLQLQLAVMDGEFDPATARRQFVIACSDYGSAAIVPGLMARLRDRAPGADLRVVPSQVGMAEALQTGRVDLAIGAFGRVPDRFAAEDLFQETLVWVLSADNPACREPITLERLAELPHLIIALAGEDARAVDGLVSDHGLEMALDPRRRRRVSGRAVGARPGAAHRPNRAARAGGTPHRRPFRHGGIVAASAGGHVRRALPSPSVRAPLSLSTACGHGRVGPRSRRKGAGAVVPAHVARGRPRGRGRQPPEPVHRLLLGHLRLSQLVMATSAVMR